MRSALLAGLAVTCVIAIVLVPDWEGELHAQGYEVLSGIVSEALGNVGRRRELVSERLENARETSAFRQFASARLHGTGWATATRRWGAFLAFDRNTIRRGSSRGNNAFNDEIPGLLGGLDYRLSPELLIGGAMALRFSEKSFADTSTLPTNPTEVGTRRTFTVLAGPYLSYTPNQHWYGSFSLLVGRLDVRTRRSGSGLKGVARGDTDGHALSVGATGGYEWQYRALGFGPMLNVGYDRVNVEGYTEQGHFPKDEDPRLVVGDATGDLLTCRSGVRGYYVQASRWGALIPNWRLLYVYRDSFESGTASLSFLKGQPVGGCCRVSPDPASLDLGLGLQVALPGELTLWLDYQENFLERLLQRTRLTVGIRKQF